MAKVEKQHPWDVAKLEQKQNPTSPNCLFSSNNCVTTNTDSVLLFIFNRDYPNLGVKK